jgi:NADH dehydrogenase
MKRILILGGTGFVGRHVCEKLARLPWRITLVTRRAVNAQHLQHLPRLDVVQADVHDEAALARLLPGHDAVLNLVAILHGNEAAFERTHVELPAKLARACLAAGVPRLLHMSALGVDARHPDTPPSRYLRSKSRGETALQQAAAAGLQVTVLRPSVIFGAGDRFLTLFARLQHTFPILPLAGASARLQPVWVEDVAQAVTHCLEDPTTCGQSYELCGPQTFSLKALVQLAGQLSGVRRGRGRPIVALPPLLGRWQAALLELLPGPPLMSRDNLDSLRIDNLASGKQPGLSALGIEANHLTAIAPLYLATRDRCNELRQQAHHG